MTVGYETVTYKMKLTCKRLDWLIETKALYNRVRTFYHALLQEHSELHALSSQAILRELEKLSLPQRGGTEPVQPLPFDGVPAYFRRSAANGAIGAYKTYIKNHKRWEQEHSSAQTNSSKQVPSGGDPAPNSSKPGPGSGDPVRNSVECVRNSTEQTTNSGRWVLTGGRKLLKAEPSGAEPAPNSRKSAQSSVERVANSSEPSLYGAAQVPNSIRKSAKSEPKPAEAFESSPVFYKGMYKDLTENSITLKLWTGTSWAWVRCRYRGRRIPETAQLLSPTVVIKKKRAMLHIPVNQPVEDIRPVKERVEQGDPVCSVAFTNTDAIAVCSILTVDGRMAASRFIRGGSEYVHHSKRLLERIRSNRAVLGRRFDWTGCNKRYWEHLYNLSDYWAHKVSKKIVDFCLKHGAKTISLMEPNAARMKQIAAKSGKYSPIYLSLRIRRYLAYKAWAAGIAITMVKPGAMTRACSRCGAQRMEIARTLDGITQKKSLKAEVRQKRVFRPSRTFLCSKGHEVNWDLNTSRNIGRSCLNKLGKGSSLPA